MSLLTWRCLLSLMLWGSDELLPVASIPAHLKITKQYWVKSLFIPTALLHWTQSNWLDWREYLNVGISHKLHGNFPSRGNLTFLEHQQISLNLQSSQQGHSAEGNNNAWSEESPFSTGTAEAALCGSKHWSLAAQDGWRNTGGLVLLPFSSARDGCGLKGNYHQFQLRESQALATAIHLLTGQIDSIVQDILEELFQTICDLMVGFIITQCCGGQIYKQVQKWISKIHGR